MSENSSALLAFEKAQELSARVDAFFNRREERYKRKKAAKRARLDGDDPSHPTAPPDFREDGYVPEERGELRQGALSKE